MWLINCLFLTGISYFSSLFLDINQRISTRTSRYLSVSTRWQQEKDAPHHNSHWLGFTIREAMFARYQAQQKFRISMTMLEHCLWSWHQRRWLSWSHMLQVKSRETGMLYLWTSYGRIPTPRHCHLGNLSSEITCIFNCVCCRTFKCVVEA